MPRRSIWTLVAMLALGAVTEASPVMHGVGTPTHLNLSPSPLTASAPFSTSVRFVNPTPHRRIEWGFATVPFPKGVWTPEKTFRAQGYQSELTPFGLRWPDNSVRFAQLAVLLDLAPEEERIVQVVQNGRPASRFALSPWTAHGFQLLNFVVSADVNGQTQTAALRPLTLTRNNNAVKTVYYRGRIPRTDLVVDLWLSLLSNADHAPFELRVTSSSTGSQEWYSRIDSLDVLVTGAFADFRGTSRKNITWTPRTPMGPNLYRLLGKSKFFDGQGQAWWGDLMFAHASVDPGNRNSGARANTLSAVEKFPLYGVSRDWASSGAFGPFGHVPAAPPWVKDGGRSSSIAQRDAFERWVSKPGSPWDDWPMGLLPYAASPGDQQDFGAAKLVQIFASGYPHGIEEAKLSMDEEAMRPVHHREADGSPVTAWNHRQWVAWDGRTHFNTTVSPDRLGKPFPAAPVDANGWVGKDHEHWSSLTLASAYLLTGSDSLLYELNTEAELYISSHTIPSEKPNFSTNGIGAARAVGRTFLSMSWNYLCTARADLKRRMVARIDEVVGPQAMWNRIQGLVRPCSVRQPDARLLNRNNWRPWEETLAVLGLEACSRVTGSVTAHQVAAVTANTVLSWGWLQGTGPDKSIIGTAIGWKQGGTPLTPQEYQNPSWVLWSFGTNFNEWATSAIKLSQRYGPLYNNWGLASTANKLYQQVQGARAKPPFNGWGRFSEWDAVQ